MVPTYCLEAVTRERRQIIGEFPESPYQRALMTVTDLVTDRDHQPDELSAGMETWGEPEPEENAVQ